MNQPMEQPPLTIRPFAHADTALVAEFLAALSERTYYFFHPHRFTPEVAEQLTGPDVDDPATLRFMALQDAGSGSRMVGYVFFWAWTAPVVWLGLAVRDDYQEQGLGGRLMRHAIAEARRAGKEAIQLTTMQDNARGLALYQRCGFGIIGRTEEGEHLLRLDLNGGQTP
ncbi:MAG: GNAT family N-acetyltransferase [Anaerolineae bacterium]